MIVNLDSIKYIFQIPLEWYKKAHNACFKSFGEEFIVVTPQDNGANKIGIDEPSFAAAVEKYAQGKVKTVDGHEPDDDGDIDFNLESEKWLKADEDGHISYSDEDPITLDDSEQGVMFNSFGSLVYKTVGNGNTYDIASGGHTHDEYATTEELDVVDQKADLALDTATDAAQVAGAAQTTAGQAAASAAAAAQAASVADGKAVTAQGRADDAYDFATNNWQYILQVAEIANGADTNAKAAIIEAQNAKADAADAYDLASTANTTANSAKTTANTANTTANSAMDIAEGAEATAEDALNAVDALTTVVNTINNNYLSKADGRSGSVTVVTAVTWSGTAINVTKANINFTNGLFTGTTTASGVTIDTVTYNPKS